MDEGIAYEHDAQSLLFAEAIREHLRKKASKAEFRRRCEECRRLALDATPMGEGERARVERELGRGKGA